MNWLTPSLQEDFSRFLARYTNRWPTTNIDPSQEQRRKVLTAAALLPGLRLCERRRLVLLAQSAPPVEIGRLAEALDRLTSNFDQLWPTLPEHHEQLIQRSRLHLGELYTFAQQLEDVRQRRDDAEKMLFELEEGVAFLHDKEPASEPIFHYIGYETDAIMSALRDISYPQALNLPSPRI